MGSQTQDWWESRNSFTREQARRRLPFDITKVYTATPLSEGTAQ